MKKQAKILVVGSLVMDLIVTTPRFPQEGETVLGTDYTTASGGKGANQAVQAALLGADVTMVGRIGEDVFGEAMRESLNSAGVHTDHLLNTPGVSSAIGNIQIESIPGQPAKNRIIVVSGANMKITEDDISFLEDTICDYDMVLLQFEIPMTINEKVALLAKSHGVPVMINTAPSNRADGRLLSCAAYVSPNEHEAYDMTGVMVRDKASAQEAAEFFLSRGVEHVLVTCGETGCVLVDRTGYLSSPAIYCEHVEDPTAAGDSFIAAFCTAVSLGASHPQAMRFANYTAHITVSRKGAQPSLPTLHEVTTLMKENSEDLSWL